MPILKHIVKKDTSVLLDIKKYFTILLKNDLFFMQHHNQSKCI